MSRRAISLLTALKQSVPRKAALLIAVSGGKDSVALLDGLYRIQRMLGLKLEVAHVNHNLRQSSAADVNFVKQLAGKYGLVFHQKSLEPPKPGVNIENWGRKERYKYFNSLLKDRGLDFIVTAHHSDDVAETFLMRLVSNKELRSIHAFSSKYRLLRPLLLVTKKEIGRYLSHHNLLFQEDETNAENKFLRNKIRNILLPELQEKFHPRVSQWISERARMIDKDARCLDKLAKAALKELKGEELSSSRFQESLKSQPVVIGIRMVEFAFLDKLDFRLGYARARLVRRVLLGQVSKCNLPNGFKLYWSKERLVFQHSETANDVP